MLGFNLLAPDANQAPKKKNTFHDAGVMPHSLGEELKS